MSELVLDQVTKEYPTPAEPLKVLNGCSLTVSAGETVAIIGPSGSGKSTLLQILGTLDQPTSGQLSLLGQNPFALTPAGLAEFRNRHLGFVFQDHHLLPQCNVHENVLLPAIARGRASAEAVERGRWLIEQVGLAARSGHRPAELSGGERQRVAIARALICRPALVLADEPTGNLDGGTATVIGDLLLSLQAREQTMLVVVTHSQELAQRMQRRFRLDNGVLRAVA